MNHPEEWREIAWAPNYEFSSLGQVRRTTYAPGTFAGRVLSQSTANGYRQLNLSLNGKVTTRKVHRLICEAFHGPPPSVLHQVAHADGKRTNNRAENLRWALPVENAGDNLRNGVRLMGESHPLAKLTEADVVAIRNAHRDFVDDLAKQYGLKRGSMSAIITGRAWRLIGAAHDHPPTTSASSNALA